MNAAKCFCLAVLLSLLAAGAARAADASPTKFARIDLLDGRTLKNVELVSYDAATDKVLLVADQKAMSVPLNLIPAPFAARFKHDLPESGASASVVTPAAAPAPQTVVRPLPVVPMPLPANPAVAGGDQALAVHQQAA